jgi:hypothetical protein
MTEEFTLTAEYPGTPEEVRVEWSEDQLRTSGTVQPGTPQKLNTFGQPKRTRTSQNWAPLTAATISMTALSGAIPKPN